MHARLCAALVAAVAVLTPVPMAAQEDIPSPPPAVEGATPQAVLEALAVHSRHTATIVDGDLRGEGADFLRTLGGQSQFVILGESHGAAGVLHFATAYWRTLNALGFNYAVVETDPWVARAAERELRAGGVDGWARFLGARGGTVAAPFLTWAPEAAYTNEIVTRSQARRAPVLWGIDQVFIGAAPWLMREIADKADAPAARSMAAALLGDAADPMTWLQRADTQKLEDLRRALDRRRDADFAALVGAMIESQRIYRPFTGGGGEMYVANTTREHLFRRLFVDYYARAEAADRAPPRVMMKLGATHGFRGAALYTQVQGFGGFVSEFAGLRGARALTVLTLCGRGGHEGNFQGGSTPCIEGDFHKSWQFLHAHVDPAAVTIFDLRTWRLRPRRWAHLPADVQRAIASYDLLVFAPATPGMTFLPGLALPATPPR